ncbi:MAG: hypothetical protein LBE12_14110 [Planctomycetaceae bacterium]|jgi:hypothetical protein|nr:hypothetical protein [Planctomycetaceae bacterium]
MRTRFRFLIFFFLLIGLLTCFSGCLCDPEYCAMPNLFHPGHINEQRDRMKQFDPFIRTDIGPKIDGDRPHGSQQETPLPQHFNQYPPPNTSK